MKRSDSVTLCENVKCLICINNVITHIFAHLIIATALQTWEIIKMSRMCALAFEFVIAHLQFARSMHAHASTQVHGETKLLLSTQFISASHQLRPNA